MSNKWVNNVGKILRGAKGPYLVLGNTRAKSDKYKTVVELTVKDGAGNLLAKVTNPLINLKDPRKGKSTEDAAKVPDIVRYELAIPPASEKE